MPFEKAPAANERQQRAMPGGVGSCPTDKSESRMEGTHLTPIRVKLITRLRESRTKRGKSPMATHGRGFPSTPDTDSEQGFKFIRSCT
eukprot:5683655-Pleurochrysis_carterae.AAC.2